MTADPNAIAVTQVAYNAGFRGQALVSAVALALAESGGNPAAINTKPPDYSVGLWQINYYGGLRQPRTQSFGPPEALYSTNPLGPEANANAKAAFALSGGGKTWSPWQADFNNGRYYTNLPKAKAAVDQFLGGAVAPGATGSPWAMSTSTGVPPATNAETGSGVDTGTGAATSEQDHCLLKLPLPLVGDPCLLSTSNARAIGGALLIASGVLVGAVGVSLMVGKSLDLGGVVGKISPSGWVGAVTASSKGGGMNERQVDTIERRAYEEGRRQGASTGRVADKKFSGVSRDPNEPF